MGQFFDTSKIEIFLCINDFPLLTTQKYFKMHYKHIFTILKN